jgi:hypothetical protein
MAIETSATQQSRRPRHNPENNNPIDNGRENLLVTLGFSPNIPLQESLVAYKIPSFAGAKTSARATPSRIFHLIRRIFTHVFFLF